MRASTGDKAVGSIRLILVLMMLVAGLVAGCAAEEPSGNGAPPGADTEAVNPPDSGTSDATATRPAGELPAGATHAIADVLDSPSDGLQVVLVGEITEMLSAEDFMLKDSTGEVFVDGDNDFGTLAVGDKLSVTGTVKIEDSPTRVEIDATAVVRR